MRCGVQPLRDSGETWQAMYQTFETLTCRDSEQRLLLLVACILAALPATASMAQDFGGYPHPVTNPASGLMLDLPGTGTEPTAINYGALPVLSGVHSVISQGDPTWQFRLHNYMAYHDDKFWMMWSHGPSIEDKPTQHVRYVTSADGVNWSAEQMVVGSSNQSNFRYIARGFWQREGELYALASHDEAGGYFGNNLELRGFQWNQTTSQWDSVGMLADDTINNFEPKQLPTGEWMMSRRGNNYSNDPSDRSWLIGGVDAIDDWENSPIPVAANNARLEEPNFYELPDGNLVSLYRDNSGSKRLYRSFSSDDGQSWSKPVPTNFPDATAKFYDLKTSRGDYLLFSNANPASRNPLTLSISQDGLVYTQMAKLDIPGGGSFQYPHAIERDGEIYVAFSRNKTSIELMRISLDSIDEILDYVPEPQPYQGLLNGDFENSSGTFPKDWTIVRPTPASHAGLGGSTTAAYLAKQSAGGARIMQSFASPGPEWELDLLFATEDPGDSDERGLNIIMQNSVGGGNLNLRVNGEGSVQTVASSPTTAWFDIPNLTNLVEFSTDANGDGDFSDAQDTPNVHRLMLRGDFTTGSPEYTVFLSEANSTELVANGTASRWFGGSPGEDGSVSSIAFSAQNSGGSFVVDQVEIRQLGSLPGDYNGDGQVDAADYTAWRDSLGSTTNLAADGDGSGSVNQADYQLWKNQFGNQSASNANTSVPEPSAWRLLATGCLFLFLLRQFSNAIANTAIQRFVSVWPKTDSR
ncbi:MAG: exo-alpha-sialidase [Pirellulales bacterium]